MSAVAQLVESGVVIGSGYGLGGAGFSLIYNSTGRFHIAYAATFTLGGFLSAQLATLDHVQVGLALLIGMVSGIALGVLADRWIYRPLSRSKESPNLLAVFVASLGILYIIDYGLQLFWVSTPSSPLSIVAPTIVAHSPVIITNIDLLYVSVGWVLLVVVAIFMRYSRLGRSLVAVRVNPTLSEIVGIDIDRCYRAIFAIGSLLGAAAGVLYAMKYAGSASMGESFLIYGFVIAFVSGLKGSVLKAGAVGLAGGIIVGLSGLVVGAQYQPLILFGIIIVYVVGVAIAKREFLSV